MAYTYIVIAGSSVVSIQCIEATKQTIAHTHQQYMKQQFVIYANVLVMSGRRRIG